MSSPIPPPLTITPAGTVTFNGAVYRQVPIDKLPPSPVAGNTCYWCVAYSNMWLCDAICGHCKLEHVFIKKEDRNV